jgi:Cytochrome c7 and related cytochrome c
MRWRRQLLCLALPAAAAAQTDPLGVLACTECHTQARSQPATSMAHALETVGECKILIDHPVLTVNVGRYSYRIERKGRQSSYSVSDGVKTVTMPIRWAMGASSAIGQTYVLEKGGEFYESRVSFFKELNGLAPTLGSEGSAPADVNEAAGRLMNRDDKLRCFGCHATTATLGRQLTLDKMTPGVQCGRCHESVETHLSAMLLDSSKLEVPKGLSKLRGLSAEQASNFCGQCHRTWEEIALQGSPSIANIRFQPYRLTGSKCYDADDARISCLACHDPHQEVSSKSADYDAKCEACHGGGKPGAKACTVSTDKCVTCHMPKLELPGAHNKFSDHRIRIVRPNEKYPG